MTDELIRETPRELTLMDQVDNPNFVVLALG